MKIYKFLLVALFVFNFSFANNPTDNKNTINKLKDLYKVFEEAFNSKNAENSKKVFLYEGAPINIIVKTEDGPKDYFSTNAQFFINYYTNRKESQKLKFTNSNYKIIADGVAISTADFAETIGENAPSTGVDVLMYIKTDKGWKIASMHNTVVLNGENKNYSELLKINNNAEELPKQFMDLVEKRDRYKLFELFHTPFAPNISLKEEFKGEFNYPINTAGGLIMYLTRSRRAENANFIFSNIESTVIDQYITILTMDYSYKVGEQVRSTGKHIWMVYATAQNGWKVSQIISSRK